MVSSMGGEVVHARLLAIGLIVVTGLSACLSASAIAEQPPYVLGPGDVVEVVVFGNPEVSRTVTVRPDGMISLPLVGEVEAAGLTPEQLREKITPLIAAFVRQPRVTVIVREFRRIRVSVLGQVSHPGVFELSQGAAVLDALAAAAGLTPDAGLGEARIIRGSDPPTIIDLEQLLLQGNLSFNLPLESGDTLFVLDDSSARVYVLGQVTHPGVVPLRGALTALQALTISGGPTTRALLSNAQVIRRGSPSPVAPQTVPVNTTVVARQEGPPIKVMPVDLAKVILDGDIARDILLRRGDILYVPENPWALDNINVLLGVAGNVAYLLRR
jgi:polysaccharide biosynthesis/export protein